MIKKLTQTGEYSFGELIKAQRIAKGLSIRETADLTGYSSAAISRWEGGSRIPSIETFNEVMAALGAELYVIGK